jgi:hypothetical protein
MKHLIKYFLIFTVFVTYNHSIKAQSYNLPRCLEGVSGMIYYNNTLLAIDDHGSSMIYYIDTTGDVFDSVDTHIAFKDLEEISQDSLYVYLGDFGNNDTGNRTDLKIYKILKSSLSGQLKIDSICFSYSNQTDFSQQANNKTDFDCEAMIIKDSSIYLFNKQWISMKTSLYRIPNTIGNQTAELISTYNINGLITGADYIKEINKIMLVGYSKVMIPFYVCLSGFQNNNNFLGYTIYKQNLINYTFHQIESITNSDTTTFYLANEKLTYNGATITQQLHKLYIPNYSNLDNLYVSEDDAIIYPVPARNVINIKCKNIIKISIYNNIGEQVFKKKYSPRNNCKINLKNYQHGEYVVNIEKQDKSKISKRIVL